MSTSIHDIHYEFQNKNTFFFQTKKEHQQKNYNQHNSERQSVFLLNSGTRQECLLSNFCLTSVLDGLPRVIRPSSEIKVIKIRKKAVKQPLFKNKVLS